MPNQLGIDMFDLADAEDEQEDFMCSADLRAWMADNCLDLTINDAEWPFGRFNPREAFGSHSDADHVYNTPRAWAMQRYLSPRAERWDGPNADYTPESDDLPWMREAERKLTVEDVKDVLSNHYQGTPYDPYGRWGDEATRHAYRPIAVNRNCQSHIIQLRGDMPAAVQAVEWVFFGSNVFNAPVALFANADAAPEYLANTTERVDTDNLYWASRLIGALADAQFSACANHIEHYQEAVAAQSHAIINRVRREVIAAEESYEQATARLTRANDEIAAMAKKETDACLSNVLFATSLGMKNAFARNDR
jgi:dipeptidase